jgi:hypothetical protein
MLVRRGSLGALSACFVESHKVPLFEMEKIAARGFNHRSDSQPFLRNESYGFGTKQFPCPRPPVTLEEELECELDGAWPPDLIEGAESSATEVRTRTSAIKVLPQCLG